ncbi:MULTISPECIES: GLPGLI family protein [Rhodonellum]|nr:MULTISPECIES: GLPGLI family protein [Rhodonellum]SDZ07878.1 GLPGLI family protein [Rhodonellum ikkaensis]
MKKTRLIFFSILLIFFLNNPAEAQEANFAFFYEVEFSGDSLNPEKKTKDLMVLWHSDTLSLFQSYHGYQQDSVVNEYIKHPENRKGKDYTQLMLDMTVFPYPIFLYKIFKSINENTIVTYDKLFKNIYVYHQAKNQFHWKLEPGEKEINGYKCKKARLDYGGRTFFAWYSPEIPINDGPYSFNGLPGLIVEIADTQNHYRFTLVSLKKGKFDISDQRPSSARATDKKKYFGIKEEHKKNIFSQMSEFDASRVSPEDARRIQERYRRANNPLELKLD